MSIRQNSKKKNPPPLKRDEGLQDFRRIALYSFLGIAGFIMIGYFYFSRNPFTFPEWRDRMLFAGIAAAAVLAAAYFPYRKIMGEAKGTEYVKEAIGLVFSVSLLVYIVLFVYNEFRPLSFGLSYLLLFVVVFGGLSFALPAEKKSGGAVSTALLGIAGGVFMFSKTRQLGFLSYVIGFVTAVLIVAFSVFMFDEEPKE
ncbi:MAG: hypothetical protein ABH879_02835 [archaeon]